MMPEDRHEPGVTAMSPHVVASTDGVHPDILDRITRVLWAMGALGHPMRICQGLRTVEAQQALYALGRAVPGARVTNADGLIHRSNHQAGPDGLGRAVDCCFLGPDPFGESRPWRAYGACVVAVGLVWGGDWKTIPDAPHLEIPG